MRTRRTLLAMLLSMVSAEQVMAVEAIEWQKKPIKVSLQVGEQRLIHFPDHVLFGRPEALAGVLDVDSLQGTLYLTARETFSPTQVKVKLNESGDIVILDLIAIPKQGGVLDEVLISVPGSEAGAKAEVAAKSGGSTGQPTSREVENPLAGTPFDPAGSGAISPEEMIQFAAKQFYAPPRLRTTEQRLERTSANTGEDLRDLFIGRTYGQFDATTIAAWRSTTGQYLTAVRLVNRKPFKVKVNPFDLNMQFNYAAAQHIQLMQANVPGDTTMLYVITDRPFTESQYESPAPWAPVTKSDNTTKPALTQQRGTRQ